MSVEYLRISQEKVVLESELRGPTFEDCVSRSQRIAFRVVFCVTVAFLIVAFQVHQKITGQLALGTAIAAAAAGLFTFGDRWIRARTVRKGLRSAWSGGFVRKSDLEKADWFCAIFPIQFSRGLSFLAAASVLNILALWIENSWVSLGIVAQIITLQLFQFPTKRKVARWIELQLAPWQLGRR